MRLKNYLNEKRKSPREIMYHGTSSEFLRKILSKGLQYKGSDVEKVWATDRNDKLNPSRVSLEGVYLTKNIMTASSSATQAVNKFDGNALFIIVLFQPLSGLPDEDMIEIVFRNSFWRVVGKRDNPVDYQLNYTHMKLDPSLRQQLIDRFKEDFIKSVENQFDIEINPNAVKDSVLEELIVNEAERLIAYDVKDERESEFYRYRGFKQAEDSYYSKDQIEELLKNIPSPQRAEKNVLQSVDKLVKMLKKIRTAREQYTYNLRSTEPITYKGRNRIVAVVEEIEGRQIGQDKNILRVHYGKVPDQFLKDYSERIGSYEVKRN